MTDDMKAVIRNLAVAAALAWFSSWLQGGLTVVEGVRAMFALLAAFLSGFFVVTAFISFVDWWGTRRGWKW